MMACNLYNPHLFLFMLFVIIRALIADIRRLSSPDFNTFINENVSLPRPRKTAACKVFGYDSLAPCRPLTELGL